MKHIRELTPDPQNARKHNPDNVGMIVDSLNEVGAARSIVIDEEGVILAGNATIEGAAQAGIEKLKVVDATGDEIIAVRRTGLSPEQKKRLALFDNRSAELATWDPEEIKRLADHDPELLEGMFSNKEIDELTSQLMDGEEQQEAPDAQVDRAAELNEQWKVKMGDLWEIGDHRLLCGDSTNKGDVEMLMGEEEAALIATDPPYGVDYANVLGGRPKQKKGGWNEIKGDDLDDPQLGQMLFDSLSLVSAPVLFCWHSWRRVEVFLSAIRKCGWTPNGEIVWVKPGLTMGMSDYQWQHECCIYAKRKGAGRQPDRTCSTVWQFSRIQGADHPTQKPVEVYDIPLRNHTSVGDVCYEPFLGSGTAMVACEQLGRKCRGIEISPEYCAVILQRMSDMGLEPKRIE